MSPIKESNYFCSDIGYNDYRSYRRYISLFRKVKSTHKAIGETSATYLYSKNAIRNIISEIPGARFIVLLRNPVEMVTSLHSQLVLDGDENIEDFEEAWRAQDKRRAGDFLHAGCREPSFCYTKMPVVLDSSYNEYIQLFQEIRF